MTERSVTPLVANPGCHLRDTFDEPVIEALFCKMTRSGQWALPGAFLTPGAPAESVVFDVFGNEELLTKVLAIQDPSAPPYM